TNNLTLLTYRCQSRRLILKRKLNNTIVYMTKYLFFIITLICPALVYAQQTAPDAGTVYRFSVQDCVNYAYQHQDSVVNAGLDVKNAGYHVKEIIGQGLPQVSASGNFQDYIQIPTTLIPGEFIGQPGVTIPVKFG